MRISRISATLLVVGILCTPAVQAETIVGDGFSVEQAGARDGRLEIDLRLPGDAVNATVTLEAGGKPLPITGRDAFPMGDGSLAVLILVDTSDPRRKAVVAAHREQIAAMVRVAPAHARVGLARFDRDLEILVPVGGATGDLVDAATGLEAKGKVTQLFLNTLRAVEELAKEPADRRVLVVLSDALDEDRAVTREHVAERARTAGVAIVGFGFPASNHSNDIAALQTLLLLARDTGGAFVQAEDGLHVDATALDLPYSVIGGGWRIGADLSDLRSLTVNIRVPVTVTVEIDGIANSARFEVTLGVLSVAEFLQTPAGLGILLGCAIVGTLLLRRARRHRAIEVGAPIGILSVDEPDESRVPWPHAMILVEGDAPWGTAMSGDSVQIGRDADPAAGNDVILDDETVSRVHAVIRFTDGAYSVTDKQSTNGVKIGGRLTKLAPVNLGDTLELGDVTIKLIRPKPVGDIAPAAGTRLNTDKTPPVRGTKLWTGGKTENGVRGQRGDSNP